MDVSEVRAELNRLTSAAGVKNVDRLMQLVAVDDVAVVQLAQVLTSTRILTVRMRRREAQSLGPGPWGEAPWTPAVEAILVSVEDREEVETALRALTLKHVVELAKDEIVHVLQWYDREIMLAKADNDMVRAAYAEGSISYIKFLAASSPLQAAVLVESAAM